MKFIELISSTKKEEPKVELWREEGGDGRIDLMGRAETGKQKYIMNLRKGRFYRNTSAELDGLVTNERGQIVEQKDE